MITTKSLLCLLLAPKLVAYAEKWYLGCNKTKGLRVSTDEDNFVTSIISTGLNKERPGDTWVTLFPERRSLDIWTHASSNVLIKYAHFDKQLILRADSVYMNVPVQADDLIYVIEGKDEQDVQLRLTSIVNNQLHSETLILQVKRRTEGSTNSIDVSEQLPWTIFSCDREPCIMASQFPVRMPEEEKRTEDDSATILNDLGLWHLQDTDKGLVLDRPHDGKMIGREGEDPEKEKNVVETTIDANMEKVVFIENPLRDRYYAEEISVISGDLSTNKETAIAMVGLGTLGVVIGTDFGVILLGGQKYGSLKRSSLPILVLVEARLTNMPLSAHCLAVMKTLMGRVLYLGEKDIRSVFESGRREYCQDLQLKLFIVEDNKRGVDCATNEKPRVDQLQIVALESLSAETHIRDLLRLPPGLYNQKLVDALTRIPTPFFKDGGLEGIELQLRRFIKVIEGQNKTICRLVAKFNKQNGSVSRVLPYLHYQKRTRKPLPIVDLGHYIRKVISCDAKDWAVLIEQSIKLYEARAKDIEKLDQILQTRS